jgi:hypothetical protein
MKIKRRIIETVDKTKKKTEMMLRAVLQPSLTKMMATMTTGILVRSSSPRTALRNAEAMFQTVAVRSLATKPPGPNPFDVIRKECVQRHLCDEHGYRRPGVHWVFSLAVTPDDISQVRQRRMN